MGAIVEKQTKFQEETADALAQFPSLQLVEENGNPYLVGTLTLRDVNGIFVDEYAIKILQTPDYPNTFPQVYETGGRIPNNVDWHIYTDGSCCIASPPEETLICIDGITLRHFIEKHVTPYFFNQTFRRQNGYFLNERSHGDRGWLEFFFEKLQTKSIRNVIVTLEMILGGKTFDRRASCFCGRNEKFRKCHGDAYRLLSKLPPADLKRYVDKLIPITNAYL